MKLDNLIHWRVVGTPDVFTEERDGHTWQVIHSGGAVHDAGFSQIVGFERPVKTVYLSAVASLYTERGGLMVRLGIEVGGKTDWSDWFGPDNGWLGELPRLLKHGVYGLNNKVVTAFLESKCRHPAQANTSRWRDVQLEVVYADDEPEPPEPPAPNPDTPEAIRTLQEAMVLSSQLLEQTGKMIVAIGKVLAQFDDNPEM